MFGRCERLQPRHHARGARRPPQAEGGAPLRASLPIGRPAVQRDSARGAGGLVVRKASGRGLPPHRRRAAHDGPGEPSQPRGGVRDRGGGVQPSHPVRPPVRDARGDAPEAREIARDRRWPRHRVSDGSRLWRRGRESGAGRARGKAARRAPEALEAGPAKTLLLSCVDYVLARAPTEKWVSRAE